MSARFVNIDRNTPMPLPVNLKAFEKFFVHILVVANDLSNQVNDKGQLVSMVQRAKTNGFEPKEALADTGYYSQSEVQKLEDSGVEAFVAVQRQAHGRSLAWILGEEEPAVSESHDLSPLQKMKSKLSTPQGRERYALRATEKHSPTFNEQPIHLRKPIV